MKIKLKLAWAIVAFVLLAGALYWSVTYKTAEDGSDQQNADSVNAGIADDQSLGEKIYEGVTAGNPVSDIATTNPFAESNANTNPLKKAYINPFE